MKVLVTGGAGFIGRHVLQRLLIEGHEGTCFDHEEGSVTNLNFGVNAVRGMDAVIHLAGILGTSELMANPMQAVDTNVKGTLNVLGACHAWGARYVGITMPDCWPSVYQATKLCAQRLASAWHNSYGLPVSHVRAYNAYGPGQAHGEGHPRKIIPTFATAAWRDEALVVYGDGKQWVDLVHVEDVARCLVDALNYGGDEVFEAGTGTPWTVNDIAGQIVQHAGGGHILHEPMRKGETPGTYLYAANPGWVYSGGKMVDLGWAPKWDSARFHDVVDSYK